MAFDLQQTLYVPLGSSEAQPSDAGALECRSHLYSFIFNEWDSFWKLLDI